MKTIDVSIKSFEVKDFDPQTSYVKIQLLVDDGSQKALVKHLEIKDPQQLATDWFKELRQKLKDSHKPNSLDNHPLANALVIRFKQDEDVIPERLTRFLGQVSERIRSGKLAKLSYLDWQKKVVGFSVKL